MVALAAEAQEPTAPASTASQQVASQADAGLPMPPPLPLAPETLRSVTTTGPAEVVNLKLQDATRPRQPVPVTEVTERTTTTTTKQRGYRPRLNPTLVTPAATKLAPGLENLPAPASLALPVSIDQVRIMELRPLSLGDVENLAEVNNPNLKAIASQVDQAQSNLRAQISQWYPNLNLDASSLPVFTTGQARSKNAAGITTEAATDRWDLGAAITAQWSLINPQRVPTIAAARDQFEKAKYQYVISLRDLRLQAATAYFDLQQADDQVRIGQESVRASIVSLRDAKARFQAGVATKLEVLEAETQLSRDQQLLTSSLAEQAIARRALAALLDLPQNVTPTAKDPSRVVGVWQPSLQESIIAAYTFREELDQALLDISIANSQANAALGQVQPFLNIFAGFSGNVFDGQDPVIVAQPGVDGTNYDTALGVNLSWRIFDGGAAAAQSRQNKQLAQENTFRFAQRRDGIRQEVETSFYELEKNNRNIVTTSREVISARESLRLARLRFQAGVTTQREVVDNQRDLTQAEVRYSNSITDYNKRLAELRRRTGLDQVAGCTPLALPAVKPPGASAVPVEPTPLIPACQAASMGAI
ncbi:TolC family protein [Cyanobium sp. FACHB-13342]|uniref:TolC family protein n=1 Tax=Cyanobium sp. FACHB-13342 TaxID=2692793 RepID=UPI0016807CAF|nr:TolC family protein [Cyanobium sp. FACHB-13342]MBD2423660.1 TolC family protein [Cyanobium sp. FACHB-13342]